MKLRGKLLIFLIVCVVIVLTACDGSKHASPEVDPVVDVTTTTRATTTTTLSPTVEMAMWTVEHGDDMQPVLEGLTTISDAADSGDLPTVFSACTDFSMTVQQYKSDALPTPDPDLTYELGAAMDAYSRAMDACLELDTDGLTSAMDEGSQHISNATDLLGEYLP